MNTPKIPAAELKQMILQSRCLRSPAAGKLEAELFRELYFCSPLLGEATLMLRNSLGRPVLYWCQAGYQQQVPIKLSDCGFWSAHLPDGCHLRISEEAARIYILLRSADCRMHVAFEFLPSAEGAPNEVRVRICQQDQSLMVKVGPCHNVSEQFWLNPMVRAA